MNNELIKSLDFNIKHYCNLSKNLESDIRKLEDTLVLKKSLLEQSLNQVEYLKELLIKEYNKG